IYGTTAAAQRQTSLTGVVVDAQGGALPGAVVTVQHVQTGATSETSTGPDGRFSLAGLQPGGPYTVTVTMGGFAQAERRDVFLTAGETASVDFELELAGLTEEVSVRAGAALARERKRAAPTIMDVVSA